MKRQGYKDRLAEAEGKKKSMAKKKQTTKDRLHEAEPKRKKTHRMKDGTLHTGATHTKDSKPVKEGKKVSWMFGGKKYTGTLIPSKEDKDNRYARTTNGKIKVLPKKKASKK